MADPKRTEHLAGRTLRNDFTLVNMADVLFWLPVLTIDAALNDSDKLIVVPAAKQWIIQSIAVNLISTAIVGNRQMRVDIRDGSANLLASVAAGAIQTASLTRDFTFAPGLVNQTAFVDDILITSFPEGIILLPAYDVRIYDSAAVDAAADDMIVRLLVRERDDPVTT